MGEHVVWDGYLAAPPTQFFFFSPARPPPSAPYCHSSRFFFVPREYLMPRVWSHIPDVLGLYTGRNCLALGGAGWQPSSQGSSCQMKMLPLGAGWTGKHGRLPSPRFMASFMLGKRGYRRPLALSCCLVEIEIFSFLLLVIIAI